MQLKIAGRLLEILNISASIKGANLFVREISQETAQEIQQLLDREFSGMRITPQNTEISQRSSLVR